MTTDSDSTKDRNHDLVVVGSSAGGVGALSTLVSTLNKNFPAPIVLAQHLDPQRPSHLGTILERRSTLPIVVVSEHCTNSSRKRQDLCSACKQACKDRRWTRAPRSRSSRTSQTSVDMLLSSAAQSYGEHLIAVILTGSGSDGAAGAVDVKNAGGVVIIQNPANCSLSVDASFVAANSSGSRGRHGADRSVALRHSEGSRTSCRRKQMKILCAIFLTHVSAQTNIDFRNYKSSTILRRIGRRMAVTHNPTFAIMPITFVLIRKKSRNSLKHF